jgi:Fe2+ transport system protein FeoA
MDESNNVLTSLTVQETDRTCEVIPLRQLGKGRLGQLHAMDLCCEDCELLQAMGMTDQCKIRMCRRGSSCIVQVGATRLGVSARFAERILVRPIANAT